MDRTLFCYISRSSQVAKIEVQHFNYKNRYVHRTYSSKKNHQNRLLYLPVFLEKKLSETEVPLILVFPQVGFSAMVTKIGSGLTWGL